MDTLYCLSIKKDDEYHEHSVYTSFTNALITLYDIGLNKLRYLIDTEGTEEAKKYISDLKKINSIMSDYEPDTTTYLFEKKFKITKVKSMLTSKTAFQNIIEHINERFSILKHMKTTKKICFPLQILDEKAKNKWYLIDEHNAGNAIEHLEKHIQRRIDEIKLHNKEIVQGILERNNQDFISVRFTDSQEYLLNKEIFSIAVTPNTGYNLSLSSP